MAHYTYTHNKIKTTKKVGGKKKKVWKYRDQTENNTTCETQPERKMK